MLLRKCSVGILAVIVSALFALPLSTAAEWYEQANAANQRVLEGRVKDGLEQMLALFQQLDPAKDQVAYWNTGSTLIELLDQTGQHAQATQVINSVIATKIPEHNVALRQWIQFYIGRNLLRLGKSEDARGFLLAVTQGDQRLVYSPPQRAAASLLSSLALDNNDVTQAAIYMRRAVIGTLVDSAAGSEEIINRLTDYGMFLSRIRRLPEAYNLFAKLVPIYGAHIPNRGPQSLKFMRALIGTSTDVGNFAAADLILKSLKENVSAVDIVNDSIRDELFFQELYQLARLPADHDSAPKILERLKQITSRGPEFLRDHRNCVVFAYFALLGGDIDLAETFISAIQSTDPVDLRFAAYEAGIKSFIAARRNKFEEAIALSREALEKLHGFHKTFENASPNHLPALTSEERMILSLVLGLSAPHVASPEQANTLFELAQFLNRDKGKLGLNARLARQPLSSDLQRQDVRTRDRLHDLREKMLVDATDALLARILPIRNYTPVEKNEYGPLLRLEDIEDRIARTDDELRRNAPEFFNWSADRPIVLATVQRLLRADEALILHVVASGSGLITTCVTADTWTFNVKGYDKTHIQQLILDVKVLTAAVHATYATTTDVSFPADGSHRLYHALFGDLGSCLINKSHVLLATDPDFFSLPWNALLTAPQSTDQTFQYRQAPWLAQTYALSLLPSVKSLYQLRATLSSSRATEKYFVIGDPDLNGDPQPSLQASLGTLYSARGVANLKAIANLPRLPEASEELHIIAAAMNASTSHVLLGSNATERALRQQQLENYRVISFATHALVAGEVDGVIEPALVLSPGQDERNPRNDGLLTATEIANLNLDANLVILSACNTAAPDGQASGRGLSGLADSFFFAGARALAVTQWSVLSKAAQQLAFGLISRSVQPNSKGVAEGLRRSMLDYIGAAKEDYLAHPRFWAAFIIAGDGAVRPLDGVVIKENGSDTVRLQSEHTAASDSLDLEFRGLARADSGSGFYAVGRQKPSEKEKRFGSYLAQVDADAAVQVVKRDPELGASDVVAINDHIVLLGYIPEGDKSAAVFRFLDKDGNEQWQHTEHGTGWNYPISILAGPNGYILVSIETYYLTPRGPSTLVLTSVSKDGISLMQRRHTLSVQPTIFSSKTVAADSVGNLIVAIGGELPSSSSRQWTNPLTGSRNFCLSKTATALFLIDAQSLELLNEHLIEDDLIISLRPFEGHLYAAVSIRANCRLEQSARLVEVHPEELRLETVFQTANVNSIEVADLSYANERFVLVGRTRTFLPTALTVQIKGLDEIKTALSDPRDETIWEMGEDNFSAFVLVVGKDGSVVGDRVFADLRSRSLSNVAIQAPNRFVAVGGAFGNRAWVIAFALGGVTTPTRGLRILPDSAQKKP
jgi:CHAT domain-containing protein